MMVIICNFNNQICYFTHINSKTFSIYANLNLAFFFNLIYPRYDSVYR